MRFLRPKGCRMDQSVLVKTAMWQSSYSQRHAESLVPPIADTVCQTPPPIGMPTLTCGLGYSTLRRKIPHVHLVPLNVGSAAHASRRSVVTSGNKRTMTVVAGVEMKASSSFHRGCLWGDGE
jgi:hypothetical protein